MTTALVFRILVAIFSLSFFIAGLLKFMKGHRSQTFFKFFVNCIIWISIAYLAIFPNSVHVISKQLGFGESLNTFIFIGFIVVFSILFKLINVIERMEHNISEIVRKEALSKITSIK
ncbi:MAG: hypothetical protein ACD_5C00347G0004 [uncultured bacterium]|nr:MAG: hypothetical protein ACD_5C00347G0004 [uncultured bacterium]